MPEPREKPPELKEYDVMLNGQPTTVQMTEEEYKEQGWEQAPGSGGYATKKPKEDRSKAALSKSRTPDNKARYGEDK
jgi:hypothetical protein